MKSASRIRIVTCTFIVTVLALLGWRLYDRLFRQSQMVAEEPVVVSVVNVSRRDIRRYVKITGSLQPASVSNLALKVGGRVASVPVALGQTVSKGDPLVVLDSADFVSQVKAAEAAYELASANLARVEMTAPVLEVAQAETSVRQARAQVDAATRNLERMSNLYQRGAVPLVQLEAARTQFEVAAAQLDMALKNLEVVQSGTARQAIAAARAQKKQAEATMELARSQLAAATLRAPFDGTVSYVNVNPGEMAGPGVPIVGLVEKGTLVADFMVSEKQVRSVSTGQVIEVTVPSAGRTLNGVVAGVAPSADPRSRLYKVRVEIRNAPSDCKPGMMAEARVLEESRLGCLVIPEECVLGGSVDPAVFVVAGDKAHKRPVKIGISDGLFVEVLTGIQEGEEVVRKGQTFLNEGKSVKVVGRGDR